MSRTAPQLPIVAKVLIGVVLAAFAVELGGIFLSQTGMLGGQENPVSEWQGRPAPELVVSTIEGRSVRLQDLKGRRVIVDFWATWCPPCVKEVPHLQQLSEEFSDDELIVIGVSNEDVATVRTFANSHGISYPLGQPVNLATPFSDVTVLPTTVFIDRDGMIESVLHGYHSYDELREHAIKTVD
jgi:thiol-disulfide isomerase/thioredoxin